MTDTPHTDWLAELDETPDTEPEPIDLADEASALSRADWHLRHVQRIDREWGVLAAVFQAEVRRVKERWDARRDQLERDRAWHTAPLESLHAALLERDPKRKSITLPHGTLKARTDSGPTVRYFNVDAFTEWALEAAPNLVRAKWEPDKRMVARAFTARPGSCRWMTSAGEVVPGINAVPPKTTYSVAVDQ